MKRPTRGHVIQLAPPNHGSEVADFLQKIWLYKTIFGPAGQQLTTDQSQIESLFGPVDYSLGIIAGNRTMDPISSAIIPGPDDGKVSIQSTKLDGMADHIVVGASHLYFPRSKKVHHQVLHFLENGAFDKS
jgi:hypothetical protein